MVTYCRWSQISYVMRKGLPPLVTTKVPCQSAQHHNIKVPQYILKFHKTVDSILMAGITTSSSIYDLFHLIQEFWVRQGHPHWKRCLYSVPFWAGTILLQVWQWLIPYQTPAELQTTNPFKMFFIHIKDKIPPYP